MDLGEKILSRLSEIRMQLAHVGGADTSEEEILSVLDSELGVLDMEIRHLLPEAGMKVQVVEVDVPVRRPIRQLYAEIRS